MPKVTKSSAMPDYPRMFENPDLAFECPDHLTPPVVFTRNSRRYPADRTVDPLNIFMPMMRRDPNPEPRWVDLDPTPGGTQHAVLIFVDGAAPDNGQFNVRAGCGVAYDPDWIDYLSFPLERVGSAPLTSNRAELRAAHAALSHRHWVCEGFGKIVIATDSQYLVSGVNEWVLNWEQNGWKNSHRRSVANKDLWLMLLGAIKTWEDQGVTVQFYLIERRFNRADSLAKEGANDFEIPTEWQNYDYFKD